jgi:hypothetical protein
MRKMRSINGYFESSTQAMSKLLNFQSSSNIKEYNEQARPKKTLQDVETRWWSTYRSIKRLRFLKKAIQGLLITEEVTCQNLTQSEWLILHQVEITLETMAHWQRILEGESYVTGSMVAVAVYQIRQSYVDVINSDDAMPGIVALSKLLLEDFDQRYVPADDTGKVKYHQTDELGKFNRYKGVHQYFMFASFLDPRVVPILSDILTQTDFNLLKSDILELMASQAKVNKDKPTTNNQQATQVSKGPTLLVATPPNKAKTKQSRIMEKMFSGLKTHGTIDLTAPDEDDNSIQQISVMELEQYLRDAKSGACPMYNAESEFNNPLGWWKQNCVRYPCAANLARKFLAIPATSAPSERIWSRAGRILSLRRARLKEEVVGHMMLIKENLRLLHKHYCQLAKNEKEKHLHYLVDLDLKFLPPLPEQEEENIDVGQDDLF